jgi:aquaporin Z
MTHAWGDEMARKLAAEFTGTVLLVFFGIGMATLVFGFRIFGDSVVAGVLTVAIMFGLTYAALVYVIGPISGGHVNPAVTLGAFLAKRIKALDLIGYWAAQMAGAVAGAALVLWLLNTSPFYRKSREGLGTNGYGANSILHVGASGAFLAEVLLTTAFVLVVLSLTREGATVAVAGMGIGVALTLVNLLGIPFDGCSVNPARSFGPAVLVGGASLSQLWVFLVAPLVGAALAAGISILFYPLAPSAEAPEDSTLTEQTTQQGEASQPGDPATEDPR